ncbi:MAG: GGDEF domain-containing protein [Actinobacteria bacterium]|nr:GGDEF domain-containing protein [Actinomycetota bacterium]
MLPPLAYLLAVAVLRHAEGGSASGYGPLVLIPLFWVALYAERAQVATVVVGIVLVFMLPIVVIGSPGYPSTEWRRPLVWFVVAPTVGLVVNDLVRRIRTEAAANERRARALDAVAGISRGLGHGADTRLGICEAALTVSEAGAAFLVEPDGDGRLRSTAVVGVDLTEIVVTVGEQPSAIVTAYTSGERLFIRDAVDDPRVSPRLVEATAAASLLLEPVVRRGDVVGVLVVLWRWRVAGLDDFSAMVTTLLATEAGVAIERSDLLLQLDEMARTDKLTGLRNRRAFDELLEREMARSKRTGEPLALALVDLDRFKSYNDTHGPTRPATNCWPPRPQRGGRSCVTSTCSLGGAARSSWRCCPGRDHRRHARQSSACGQPLRSSRPARPASPCGTARRRPPA